MKLFCIVLMNFAAILSVTTAHEIDIADQEALQDKIWKETDECRKGFMGPDGERRFATEQELRCIGACYMEKLGLMDENNKLVVEALASMFIDSMKTSTGMTYTELCKDVGEKCKEVTDVDKCEASDKIMDCLHDETVKLKFEDEAELLFG